jgi:hypothetical protein
MVTYKIELNRAGSLSQWKMVAACGNDLQWVVGHYPDKCRAEERIARIEEIRKSNLLNAWRKERPHPEGAALSQIPHMKCGRSAQPDT